LIDENYQEHAHARVCSALTHSVLQCPGVMRNGDGVWAHLAACAFRDETSPDPMMDIRNYGSKCTRCSVNISESSHWPVCAL